MKRPLATAHKDCIEIAVAEAAATGRYGESAPSAAIWSPSIARRRQSHRLVSTHTRLTDGWEPIKPRNAMWALRGGGETGIRTLDTLPYT